MHALVNLFAKGLGHLGTGIGTGIQVLFSSYTTWY